MIVEFLLRMNELITKSIAIKRGIGQYFKILVLAKFHLSCKN